MIFRKFLAALILCSVKVLSHLFFRLKVNWKTEHPAQPFENLKLLALLNHTSLYEPIFVAALPFRILIRLSQNFSAPGADKTLDRPIVGTFWKLMTPTMTTITRKRDHTWTGYLDSITPSSIVVIAPEGRMKRPTGLDVNGNPMTIKPGIADILERLHDGDFIIAKSGGLHHVQSPGQLIPRLFQPIELNLYWYKISDYKAKLAANGGSWRGVVVADLQKVLDESFY